MTTLSKENIKEIADQMDMGLNAFFHKETGELIFVPDLDQFYGMDLEGWDEDFDKLKKNKKKFIEIEKQRSHDSFQAMQDFAEQVDDTSTRTKLLEALNRKKPFSNFKDAVDNSGDYREQWFAFKDKRNIEWVEAALKYLEK